MSELQPVRIAIRRPEKMPTEAEVREWEWKHEVMPRLRGVRLEPRFCQRITDWNCPPQEKVFQRCRKLLAGTGAIIALIGVRGAGKTTLATQLIVERAVEFFDHPERWPAPYTKLTDLINLFKPIYADHGSIDAESLTRRRDEFCRYPLRIIDEIHECDDQRMKNRVLADILDRCYARRVDSVIISNQTYDDFAGSTSDSILSRISEHGVIIPCTWESWRGKR